LLMHTVFAKHWSNVETCKRAGAQWLVSYFANQIIERGWGVQ
jgi:delta-aminolevulinic acid dehydratase/porphobilinogen synthase